jgi:hypothetical protein
MYLRVMHVRARHLRARHVIVRHERSMLVMEIHVSLRYVMVWNVRGMHV